MDRYQVAYAVGQLLGHVSVFALILLVVCLLLIVVGWLIRRVRSAYPEK